MGRPSRPEWQYVQRVAALPKGQWTCKCIYCGHVWAGGPFRIRTHLLGISGHGVGPCEKVPEATAEIVRKLHADAKHDGKDSSAFVNALVDDLGGGASASQSQGDDTHGHAEGSTQASGASKCSVGASSKKRKVTQTGLANVFALQARKQADQALRRFFYAEDIPEWKVKSPYFLEMVKAIGNVGSSYVPPSYHALRTTELNDEVQCIKSEMMGLREKWKRHGCTIVCDGWSDTRRRPIINFMACSIHGSMFLKSIDTSGETKSGDFIFRHLKEVILEVGPKNVVQVCMDNASNCILAGEMVEREWPHIFHTRCACHCLDLLFEDIGKIEWIAKVLDNATKIVTFVTRKSTVLAVFRELSKKDLVKPVATRFAYYFITLANLLDERCMQGVRKLMIDDKFTRMKVSRTPKAIEVSDIVFNASFWQEAKLILKICAPILKILRLADREGATIGLMYELTDRMVEQIENMQGIDPIKMKEIKDLCVDRWDMMHTPLHAVGYMLHPVWRGRGQDSDREVHEGWMTFLNKYTNGDLAMQGVLIDELDTYRAESKSFAHPIAKDPKRMQEGVKWWETFGACTPTLQALALKVLSQGTCASPCEKLEHLLSHSHQEKEQVATCSYREACVHTH